MYIFLINYLIFADLRSSLLSRDQEISDLNIKLDDKNKHISQESHLQKELQLHYQQRLRAKDAELEQLRM